MNKMWHGGINCGAGLPRILFLFFFWLTVRNRHFQKYLILTFRDKTASIIMYEFIVMHARSDSLWLSLVHSVSLFLPLTHSGSLWLTLWLFQALWLTSPLLGSPRRGCMATIIPPCDVDHTSLMIELPFGSFHSANPTGL